MQKRRGFLPSAVVAALFSLSSCDGVSTSEFDDFSSDLELEDATRLDVNYIIDQFFDGKIWCTGFERADSSCTSVQRMTRRTADGMILHQYFGYQTRPYFVKESFLRRTYVRGNMLCSDSLDPTEPDTVEYILSNDRNAEVGIDDIDAASSSDEQSRRFAEEQTARLREEMTREQVERCIAYFRNDNPPEGVNNETIMVMFENGVQQPVDRDFDRASFFVEDSSFILRDIYEER